MAILIAKDWRYLLGEYVNSGFCSIPNWEVGCELSYAMDDVMWNSTSIGNALNNKGVGKVITMAIAEFTKE